MRAMIPTTETAFWISEHNPLPVVAHDEPSDGSNGFDPRSAYVETYWLAVLGPSSILAARRMADWLDGQPSGIVIGLEELGQSLGLGHGIGRASPVVRTLDRLVMFGFAQIAWDAYALRRTVPPLPARHQRRLPGYLIERHHQDLTRMVGEAAARTVGGALRT